MITPKVKKGTKALQYHSQNRQWFLDELRKHTQADVYGFEDLGNNSAVLNIGWQSMHLVDDDWLLVYPDGEAESFMESEYARKFDSV